MYLYVYEYVRRLCEFIEIYSAFYELGDLHGLWTRSKTHTHTLVQMTRIIYIAFQSQRRRRPPLNNYARASNVRTAKYCTPEHFANLYLYGKAHTHTHTPIIIIMHSAAHMMCRRCGRCCK